MASKITIRRIGSVLPTVCLLVFILLCVSVLLLSTVGLPGAVLRYVEQQAAQQGLTLRLDSLRLYPSRGLAVRAEGVKIFESDTAESPLASLGSLAVGVKVSELFTGNISPTFFMISGGQVELPVTSPAGEHLTLSDITFAARFDRRERVQVTSGFMRVQGIPIRVQGVVNPAEIQAGIAALAEKKAHREESADDGDTPGEEAPVAQDDSASDSLDLAQLIADNQEYINKAYQYITEQHWEPTQYPMLELMLAAQKEFYVSVRSTIPSLNLGQYHFRDVNVELVANFKKLSIKSLSFNTVDPEARATFDGSYDLTTRHLSFHMNSNAALLRMVRSMSTGELKAYLEKFRHPDTSLPVIGLEGDIRFEENYSLRSARVRGRVEQENLSVGSTLIRSAVLSFYYNNGNFTIDELSLLLPDGSLVCHASAQHGQGKADLEAKLPVQRVLTLMRELGVEDAALPEGLSLGESVHIHACATLTTPPFLAGNTHWQGFVPAISTLNLSCETDSLSYDDYSLQKPVLRLNMYDMKEELGFILSYLGSADLLIKAEQAQLAGAQPITLQKPCLYLTLDSLSCGHTFMDQEPADEEAAQLTANDADTPEPTQETQKELKFFPKHLKSTTFELKASRMQQAGEQPLTVQTPHLYLVLDNISCGYAHEDEKQGTPTPQKLKLVSSSLGAAELMVEMFEVQKGAQEDESLVTISSPGSQIKLKSLSFVEQKKDFSLKVSEVGAEGWLSSAKTPHGSCNSLGLAVNGKQVDINQLWRELGAPSSSVAAPTLGTPENNSSAEPGAPKNGISLQDCLSSFSFKASAEQLIREETLWGNAVFHFEMPQKGDGKIELSLSHQDHSKTFSLHAVPSYSGGNIFKIGDIAGEVNPAAFSFLPDLLGESLKDLELPELVKLSGNCELNLKPFAFKQGDFAIEIPRLVRTPWRQRVFVGKRVPLSLAADVQLNHPTAQNYVYDVALRAKHDTGEFNGKIVGDTTGSVRVTGTNTIRPDIVDQLIDNRDAHEILRDFRFPAGGHAVIKDIDTRVYFSNGVRVESTCAVELYQTEYLLGIMKDVKQGNIVTSEKRDSDLDYTLVNSASCVVDVHVVDGAKTPRGEELPREGVVTIKNPVLNYNNTPWLNRHHFEKGVRETRLTGHAIIIDIMNSFVELQDVRGTVYPAYSLGMFYSPLQSFMKDISLPLPAQVETDRCVFPIASDCKRPMSGTIRAISHDSASFHFLGTEIPLDEFSGFIYLTDDYVLLDRMNAKCWEGVLNAKVKIGISGDHTSFDGCAQAQCMNLKKIAAAYNSTQEPALCNGEIRFRSPSADLKSVKAYGHAEIVDGDLMKLRVFHPVSDLITNLPSHFLSLQREISSLAGQPETEPGPIFKFFSYIFRGVGKAASKTGDGMGHVVSNMPLVNHLIAYDLQTAKTDFDIMNGYFVSRNMNVTGSNLNVDINLAINLDTMELHGNLWPRISGLPNIILSPFTFLSDFMIDIILYGKVEDIKWSIGLSRRKPTTPPSATSETQQSPPPRR